MARKFKIGDIVKFIKFGGNSKLFTKGLENLEIKGYAGSDFEVWESDKNSSWFVKADELELMESREDAIKRKKDKFKNGFNVLYKYIDFIPKEEREEVKERLGEVGL